MACNQTAGDPHITNPLLYVPQHDSVLTAAIIDELHYSIVSESEQINLNLQLLDIVSDSIISLGELSKRNNSLFFFFQNINVANVLTAS